MKVVTLKFHDNLFVFILFEQSNLEILSFFVSMFFCLFVFIVWLLTWLVAWFLVVPIGKTLNGKPYEKNHKL